MTELDELYQDVEAMDEDVREILKGLEDMFAAIFQIGAGIILAKGADSEAVAQNGLIDGHRLVAVHKAQALAEELGLMKTAIEAMRV